MVGGRRGVIGANEGTLSRRSFLGVASAAGIAAGAAAAVGPVWLGPAPLEADAATSKPTLGGTLAWAQSADFNLLGLDPAIGSGVVGVQGMALYDALAVQNTANLVVQPRIASSMTVDSSGLVWTIKLHQNILFSDGTAYDASAIKALWDRVALPATASISRASIAGWTWVVTDPQTLTVTVPTPLGNFTELLAGALGSIPSPAAVAKSGKLFGSGPGYVVGAGPFTLKSWLPGNQMSLSKNPNYWVAGQPYLDAINIVIIPDNATKLEAMLSNTADIGYFSSADVNTKTLAHEGFQASVSTTANAYGVEFNPNRAPFNDVRVRRALVQAIDCVDTNLKATDGAAALANTSWYPKGSPFYDESVKQAPYNLKEAQKLIDAYISEKGAIPAQTLTVPNVSFLVALGTALVQGWSKLTGISVTANVITSSQATTLLSQGNFGVAATLTPAYLYPADAYPTYYSTSTSNVIHYSNPKMDAVLTSSRGYSSIPQRKTALNQIAQILINDAIYLRIYYVVFNNFAQKTVGGLKTLDFSTVGFPMPQTLYLKSS
jgi:peptide/nickel transport system substrate-binding protein